MNRNSYSIGSTSMERNNRRYEYGVDRINSCMSDQNNNGYIPSALNTSNLAGELNINYSTRHDIGYIPPHPTRNINTKNLSLDLLGRQGGSRSRINQSIPTHSISREPLTISIPYNNNPDTLQTPNVTNTPTVAPPINGRFTPSETENDDISTQPKHAPYFMNQFSKLGNDNSLRSPLFQGKNNQDIAQITLPQNLKSVPLNFEVTCEHMDSETYPKGPANVLNGNIYLFSDPEQSSVKVDINDFDLVINVAKECRNLSGSFSKEDGKEYLYFPWSHTSAISKELPLLTKKMQEYDDTLKSGHKRKILVHCQCGVSRSACVIVAYFMFKFNIELNEAYDLLKSGTNGTAGLNSILNSKGYMVEPCGRICPNMSLIFELMDFGEYLNNNR